jgi:hypothetical protein
LVELLRFLGFTNIWINWIVELLHTASTKVLMNGALDARIRHGWGLRQGDPLSPMLFIIVMNALDDIFYKAHQWSLLQSVEVRGITHRALMYADNVIIILSPVARELETASNIFKIFKGASGLGCNLSKCQISPIRCDPSHLELAAHFFLCAMVDFPLRYLGIPLSVMTLPRGVWQRLINGMADMLLTWKERLMHKSSRLTLINSTLAVVPVHMAISLELPAWVRKAMVKIMRYFLLMVTYSIERSKCAMDGAGCSGQRTLVAWASPTSGQWT